MKKEGIYRAAYVLFTHRPVVVAYGNHTKPKTELPSGQFKRAACARDAASARNAAYTRIECYSTAVAYY